MKVFCTLVCILGALQTSTALTPLVLTTWDFLNATQSGWNAVFNNSGSALDGIEQGITRCEVEQCHGAVGWGNKMDENGETTLDSMIMDGVSHDVGAVGGLRRVKNAIGVARKVLEHTNHTLLVGDLATKFAIDMGFREESLTNNKSRDVQRDWIRDNCQPNFRRNMAPNPRTSCGPYKPINPSIVSNRQFNQNRDTKDHDTIGMVAIDKQGRIAAGTSTNGLIHKIPGRVGDSPVPGSGSYADQEVGGAACTGDGDVMMRFVPSYHATEMMRNGMSPQDAANDAILRIAKKYPKFEGAIIVANIAGQFASACWGLGSFNFAAANSLLGGATLFNVPCLNS